AVAAAPAPGASATPPIRFGVELGDGARLGHRTEMTLDLHVSAAMAPTTEVRLLTPAGITLSDTRLGATSCRRPAAEIRDVQGPVRHGRCPANSLMGTGTATAGLLLNEEQTIFGAAAIELHAGASVDDKPGLLVTADTYNPVRMQLTYAGYIYVPPDAFGIGLALFVPALPHPPFGAPVALATLHLVVGRSSITYHRTVRGRSVPYHPGGIPLPPACTPGGFRFRAILRFADGARRSADAIVPCPPAR
ncbi:MAG: hypothetical protein JWR63_451, partial [Conexibacter sp.]|nr:hypothetical protein [Conexibacter sp.]